VSLDEANIPVVVQDCATLLLVIFPIPDGIPYTVCGYWGDPRAGGKRVHQGVDLCCARGTPLLAVADGVLTQGPDPLGGTTSSLTVADGSHWYYAHESAYAAGAVPRRVVAGEIVGYCGSTGDAQAALPHLHLGHYVAGAAVDPTVDLNRAQHVPLAAGAPPVRVQTLLVGAALGLSLTAALLVVLQRSQMFRASLRP
jgi:murein DD-endopeptidase MepM/ murein hydrolase activator NlpD